VLEPRGFEVPAGSMLEPGGVVPAGFTVVPRGFVVPTGWMFEPGGVAPAGAVLAPIPVTGAFAGKPAGWFAAAVEPRAGRLPPR